MGAARVTAEHASERADPRRALGAAGEELAARHLQARGLELVDRNFRTRYGELDLVARDERYLVFCEVKTRIVWAAPGALGPLASVGPRKQQRIRAMAREWLSGAHDRLGSSSPPEIRFDAIGISLDPAGRLIELEHLEGAF
jgi:putative endonuclease